MHVLGHGRITGRAVLCNMLDLKVYVVGLYVVHTAEARSYGGMEDLKKRLLSTHFGAALGSRAVPVVSIVGVVLPVEDWE